MRSETREALELFVEKADKLRSLTYLERAEEIRFSWAWKDDKGEELEIIGPDKEQVEAFVLTLRFFIQKKEHSSFRWLWNNVLDDPGLSDHWKQELERIRDKLNEYLDKPPKVIPLKIRGEATITCGEILHTFIYGDLAHVNADKRKKYKKWMSMPKLAQGILQTQCLQIMKNLYEAINYISTLSEQELKESESN